jgi:hypothetical protein
MQKDMKANTSGKTHHTYFIFFLWWWLSLSFRLFVVGAEYNSYAFAVFFISLYWCHFCHCCDRMEGPCCWLLRLFMCVWLLTPIYANSALLHANSARLTPTPLQNNTNCHICMPATLYQLPLVDCLTCLVALLYTMTTPGRQAKDPEI